MSASSLSQRIRVLTGVGLPGPELCAAAAVQRTRAQIRTFTISLRKAELYGQNEVSSRHGTLRRFEAHSYENLLLPHPDPPDLFPSELLAPGGIPTGRGHGDQKCPHLHGRRRPAMG